MSGQGGWGRAAGGRGALKPRRARPLPSAPSLKLRPLFSECAVRRARHVGQGKKATFGGSLDVGCRCHAQSAYMASRGRAALTFAELKDRLVAEGIEAGAYDLTGGHLSERYTIRPPADFDVEADELRRHRDGELGRRPIEASSPFAWHVYYSERGNESGLRSFAEESAACEYFLGLVVSDLTVRRS